MKIVANFCLLLFGLSFFSCSSDSNSIKNSELEGTWLCVDGSIDGDKATMMIKSEKEGNPGAEIVFKGSVLTFSTLEDVNKSKDQPFTIQDKKIVCTNDKDLIFNIKEKAAKKMTLAFALQGHHLELVLEKINK